jgi:hypothetical protein
MFAALVGANGSMLLAGNPNFLARNHKSWRGMTMQSRFTDCVGFAETPHPHGLRWVSWRIGRFSVGL